MADDELAHLTTPSELVGPSPLIYEVPGVCALVLRPGPRLTWRVWIDASTAMNRFLIERPLETRFGVADLEYGQQVLAVGVIRRLDSLGGHISNVSTLVGSGAATMLPDLPSPLISPNETVSDHLTNSSASPETSLDLSPSSTPRQNASDLMAPQPTTFIAAGLNATMYAFDAPIDGLDVVFAFIGLNSDWRNLQKQGLPTMGTTVKCYQHGSASFVLIPTEALSPAAWGAVATQFLEILNVVGKWGFSFSISDEETGTEIGSGRLKLNLRLSVSNTSFANGTDSKITMNSNKELSHL